MGKENSNMRDLAKGLKIFIEIKLIFYGFTWTFASFSKYNRMLAKGWYPLVLRQEGQYFYVLTTGEYILKDLVSRDKTLIMFVKISGGLLGWRRDFFNGRLISY